MKIQKYLATLTASLTGLLAIPLVVAAATPGYSLGGAAELTQPGLDGSEYGITLTADNTLDASSNAGGNIILDELEGDPFADITTLSADYDFTAGNCVFGTGSPRFYTQLNTDTDEDPEVTVVYYFPCDADEGNSGNLAEDTDQVEVNGTNMTLSAAKELYGEATITEAAVVVDNVNDAAGRQVAVIDNIDANGVQYNFEPAVITNKDQCKNGGWEDSTDPVFKNQGDCVSSFASQKKANPITSFFRSIFNR